MKNLTKIFFFFTFLVVSSTLTIENSPAQWIAQNSSTNQNLYDVEFINENTGWAVGNAGVIIKTTNGGKNWINIPNPSPVFAPNLISVIPFDSNLVFVTSNNDFIMKTTDGGDSWKVVNYCSQCNSAMAAGQMFNQNTGWFLGSFKLLKTYDGGQTFDSLPTPVFSPVDMYFKNKDTGLICTDASRVYKTTNGGINWFDTNVPTGGVISFFRKLAVAEDQYAWVAGTDAIFYGTTNFGDSWSRLCTIPNTGIVSIDFITGNTGFAGGAPGKLFKTTDGGFSWAQEQTVPVGVILSIRFVNDLTGWYVGGSGRIYHTTTGGQTMVNISNNNETMPEEYELFQNYPNPFNPETTISFAVNNSAIIEIDIYDILGRKLVSVLKERLSSGVYSVTFNGRDLTSGVYLYNLKVNGIVKDFKRMLLIK